MNGNEAFTIAHGLVEVVQNHNDGETECFVEIFHKLHERKLMADVEIRSWLVEEERLRLLCKCHRKTRTLTFAAGERADWAHGEGLHACSCQCLTTYFLVLFGEHVPEFSMRQASHANEVEYCNIAGRFCTLGQEGDLLCNIPFAFSPYICSQELNCPAVRLEEAGKRL